LLFVKALMLCFCLLPLFLLNSIRMPPCAAGIFDVTGKECKVGCGVQGKSEWHFGRHGSLHGKAKPYTSITKQSVRGGWSGVAMGVRRSRVPLVSLELTFMFVNRKKTFLNIWNCKNIFSW
jgi:hypothetical protein